MAILLGIFEEGLIYAIMALGVYLQDPGLPGSVG